MKCPHCTVEFYPDWFVSGVSVTGGNRYGRTIGYQRACQCPSCSNYTLQQVLTDESVDDVVEDAWWQFYPRATTRAPVPQQVPANVAQDYVEACEVLTISPKASAALSRRCLQAMLRSAGYQAKDLAKEIDLLLNETDMRKAIPESLRMTIDGIRNFGNFSAHPITDVTSLQVIDVEEHEAEWCLEILEECFQHFYVRPAAAAARKAALDAKLAQGGKPPSK